MRKIVALALISIFAAACGSNSGNDEAASTDAEKEQALRDSTFGAMTETLDRAEAVEDLQLDRKKELDATLEGASGQ